MWGSLITFFIMLFLFKYYSNIYEDKLNEIAATVVYGLGALASIHYWWTIYKDNKVDMLLEARRYKHNKYDEDVCGYVRYKLDKAIDRKESIDVIDELNEAQTQKNDLDRVPDPVLRNSEREYESYKREIKDE